MAQHAECDSRTYCGIAEQEALRHIRLSAGQTYSFCREDHHGNNQYVPEKKMFSGCWNHKVESGAERRQQHQYSDTEREPEPSGF